MLYSALFYNLYKLAFPPEYAFLSVLFFIFCLLLLHPPPPHRILSFIDRSNKYIKDRGRQVFQYKKRELQRQNIKKLEQTLQGRIKIASIKVSSWFSIAS